MEKKLSFNLIITEGFQIALKNVASILGAVILWVLTLWIPYINVGTTIAIMTLPLELSKGNVVNPTFIFDPKYRRYMGEFFLLSGFMYIGIGIGFAFIIIPGIVISLAWSMSVYLLLDKGMNPTEAITKSNEVTNGYKWVMFGGKLVLGLIPAVVMIIGGAIGGIIGGIIALIGAVAFYPMILAADAVIYKALVLGGEAPQPQVQ